jgi:pimeloyl-ACP methyl ester carboxylesterase
LSPPTQRLAATVLAVAGWSSTAAPAPPSNPPPGRYARIGPLRMYYEVQGAGAPVVLLHGGGSTIQTSFGRLLPRLALSHRVIAMELQGHGHTADVDRPLSFTQDADDVAALLQQLGIARADFIGYSNGATTAVQIAIRHPRLVGRLVLISGAIAAAGFTPELRASFDRPPAAENMPEVLRTAYLAVAPRPEDLPTLVAKSVRRMREFEDIPPSAVRAIDAPALVIGGDRDVVRPEHTVEMFHIFRRGVLAILPATDHMQIVEREDLLVPIIAPFLDAPPR